jgi:hypothetical protein
MRRSVSRDHVSSNLYLHKAANTLVTGAGWLEPSPAKLGEIENWGVHEGGSERQTPQMQAKTDSELLWRVGEEVRRGDGVNCNMRQDAAGKPW